MICRSMGILHMHALNIGKMPIFCSGMNCHPERYSAKDLADLAIDARCFGVPQHDTCRFLRYIRNENALIQIRLK
jgi:hypothetical protein